MALSEPKGKVALITGGASGVGYALAERLKAEGMQLVLADYESEALERAAAALGALAVSTDVRSAESVQALAARAVERFGAVHLVCNNAGVSVMAAASRLDLQDWRWTLDVNLWGVIHGVDAFLPLLKANPDGGYILNTASLSGLYPMRAQAAYAASKFAVVGLSEALAMELEAEGGKVGVTVLCPGPVRTNISSSARNRGPAYPARSREGLGPDIHDQAFRGQLPEAVWKTARETADAAVDGVLAGEFWVITHPQLMAPFEARHRAIMAASARAEQAG